MLVEKEWKTKKKIKKKCMKKVGHFPSIFDKRKKRQKPKEKTEARKRKKRQEATKTEANYKSHF